MNQKVLILIIEDETELRLGITEMLELEGFRVKSAENGQTGLEIACREKPDLILCDILMPDMNGWEVLENWKNRNTDNHTQFILITALGERQHFRRGMEQGADDYLTKPFTRIELLAAISSQLKKKATQQALTEKSVREIEADLAIKIQELENLLLTRENEIKQAFEQNNTLKERLEKHEEELILESLNTIEISNTIHSINDTIRHELSHNNLSETDRNILLKLKSQIKTKTLLTDNWAIFQLKFNQTYPHFISRFTSHYTNLTQYDLVIVSAMITGLNTNQLADLLNISADSVRKSRFRLKKKLGLAKKDDLLTFIHTYNLPPQLEPIS